MATRLSFWISVLLVKILKNGIQSPDHSEWLLRVLEFDVTRFRSEITYVQTYKKSFTITDEGHSILF